MDLGGHLDRKENIRKMVETTKPQVATLRRGRALDDVYQRQTKHLVRLVVGNRSSTDRISFVTALQERGPVCDCVVLPADYFSDEMTCSPEHARTGCYIWLRRCLPPWSKLSLQGRRRVREAFQTVLGPQSWSKDGEYIRFFNIHLIY